MATRTKIRVALEDAVEAYFECKSKEEIENRVASVYARYFTKEEYNFSTFRLNVKELYKVLSKF